MIPRGPRAGFRQRVLALAPGGELPYRAPDWTDALVLVESGTIELESLSGVRCSFRAGAILCLTGLHLRLLRNRGASEARMSAISRR